MKPNYKFAETLLYSMMVAGAATYQAPDQPVSLAKAGCASVKQRATGSETAVSATRTDDSATAHAALFGLMKGKIKILPGFDDPLDDFAEYT